MIDLMEVISLRIGETKPSNIAEFLEVLIDVGVIDADYIPWHEKVFKAIGKIRYFEILEESSKNNKCRYIFAWRLKKVYSKHLNEMEKNYEQT